MSTDMRAGRSTEQPIGPVTAAGADAANAKERRRPALWLSWVLLLVVTWQLLRFLFTNEQLQWPTVRQFLFDETVLAGLQMTIWLTVAAMLIGVTVGGLVCLAKLSDYPPLRILATGWIALFRSIPPLVQLLFWFNLAYLVPRLSIGLGIGPSIGNWDANEVITPILAAVLGLSLYNSPYAAEIIRSGLLSVPKGQLEAAASLGLPWRHTFFRIRLPQALRVILPPLGSQAINTVKGSALVLVLGMSDLLGAVTAIYNKNFQVMPLLIVAILWYGLLVGLLTLAQSWLERRFSRGF